MLPEEADFLARICSEPDDDGPRLVFADWLDEHDQPERAEFIRVQCALAHLPTDDPRHYLLTTIETSLLARFHALWSRPLIGIAGWAEFRRGFVETVNIAAKQFLQRAETLFALAPVQHVRFLDVGSNLPHLMKSKHLERLAGITIYAQHLGEELPRELTASPHLGNLRLLNIRRNRIGDRGAERLARSPCVRTLTHLDLGDNALGDTGVRALAESSNLGQLVELNLWRNEVTRAGLGCLTTASALTHLVRLGLGLNYVGGSQDQTPQPGVGNNVQALDLSENGLTADRLALLVEMPGLHALQHWDLGNNEIGNAGATLLADWSNASSLRSLLLHNNRIGDDGARALARSPYLHNVADLNLSDNPIHDSGVFEFLNTRSYPRLKRLALPCLGLTPQMRRAVSARFGN
jgi:uncharacterized protein (TIGR02996 family)